MGCFGAGLAVKLRVVALGSALSISLGCRALLQFDDAPPVSACAFSQDCAAGESCVDGLCVSNCTGARCDAGADAGVDDPGRDVIGDALVDRSILPDANSSIDHFAPEPPDRFGPLDASDAREGSVGPTCPTCTVTDLPRPCRGYPYNEPMAVFGGTPPYTWSASAPDGLALTVDGSMSDGSMAHVFGTPLRSGSLTVTIVDSANRQLKRSYDLQVRDKCWLAYVSLENGSPQLHVVDPILTTHG